MENAWNEDEERNVETNFCSNFSLEKLSKVLESSLVNQLNQALFLMFCTEVVDWT